ncbi:hypothetical protein TRAPUB_562 [Trametes pubescens]|uniref:Uncharacterized protein n=1 Tax=Trametes pubescens TaxID=154538 RepID=A0A1M2VLV5_TRAPU|nr:hypothetical protein TRAPUB_562 [Trametes pubescens]
MIPIGRLGKPDEIASIVLMLATNGYMTNKYLEDAEDPKPPTSDKRKQVDSNEQDTVGTL